MPLPDPWLDIRLQGHDDRIWWSVRRSDTPATRTRPAQTNLDWISAGFQIPADLRDWLHETVSSLGNEEGPHATGPVALPVFVNPWDESLPALDFKPEDCLARVEETLISVLGVTSERATVALAPRRGANRRQAVQLPFRVRACNGRGVYALSQIQAASWYRDAVPDYGITLDTVELGSNARPRPCDLLVCDEEEFAWLCDRPEWLARIAARLYVVLTEDHDQQASIAEIGRRTLPPGASTIWVHTPYALGREFLRRLMEGIIHDYPVHQAFKAALRPADGPGWSQPALLLSDPVANQHLRMRDSALRMYEQFLALRERLDFGSVQTALLSSPDVLTPLMTQAIAGVAEVCSRVLGNISHYSMEVADFRQETAGLEPRAEVARDMAAAREMRVRADAAVTEVVSESVRERMTEVQERRVNLRLLRMTPGTAQTFLVQKTESLAQGGRYRLRVNVGRLGEGSLIVGNSPSIDLLLPEPKNAAGHVLSIVLQALDFTVHGASLKELTLPPLGPSEPVGFDLTAPDRIGQAQLRVLVYLEHTPEEAADQAPRNHLIQSLLLQVKVSENGGYETEDVTTARVEFSRTQRFANLDALGERALSVALNLDSDDENHTAKVKVGAEHYDLHLTEAQMSQALDDFRDILKRAAYRDPQTLSGPRFLEGQTPEDRESEFDVTMRQLAEHGRRMWLGLFGNKLRRKPKLLQLVRDLETGSEKKIQIVPLRGTLFPWTSIYDAPFPNEGVAVCRGYQRVDARGDPFTCAACLQQCLHPNRAETVCVYGFWGARFPIEQVMLGADRDAVTEVRPVSGRALHVSVGLPRGPASLLPAKLGQSLGADRVLEYDDGAPAVDVLWESPDRPALLLVIGHTDVTLDARQRPVNPRITLPGVDRWLRPQDISNKLQNTGYRFLENPSPIVILAACDSAAANLSTFMDFITSFDGAGAAAVVGTETPIVEQFATAFGERLALGLFRAESLSKALLAFRRERILENNPLGFAITAFGDATLGAN